MTQSSVQTDRNFSKVYLQVNESKSRNELILALAGQVLGCRVDIRWRVSHADHQTFTMYPGYFQWNSSCMRWHQPRWLSLHYPAHTHIILISTQKLLPRINRCGVSRWNVFLSEVTPASAWAMSQTTNWCLQEHQGYNKMLFCPAQLCGNQQYIQPW